VLIDVLDQASRCTIKCIAPMPPQLTAFTRLAIS
jgi:hypothetical protein